MRIKLGALAFFFSMVPVSGCWASESETCPATSALEISADDVVSAPRGDHLLVMINFAKKYESIPTKERLCKLIETAKKIIAEKLQSNKLKKAEVILALVDKMDEYNRPNFGGMKRLGTLVIEKNDAKSVRVVKSEIGSSN